MKFITTIIKKIFSNEIPKPIGRWRIEHCNKQMNSKIDLSNEDHCGPCGQYALTKIEFTHNQNKDVQNKDVQNKDNKNLN
jgi:hypothetical protein